MHNKTSRLKLNKDENVNRYAVRGKREIERERDRDRERDSVGNTQW